MTRRTNSRPNLLIWQWNANGYNYRKAALTQLIQSKERPPDVIFIQETHAELEPHLTGYRAHASPPSARMKGKGAAQGVCTFVRKGIPFVKCGSLFGEGALEYCVTEVLVGKKSKESIFLANVYSNPAHRHQRFKTTLRKALIEAANNTVVIGGDFNAPHKEIGYTNTTAKGKELLEEAEEAGFTILNDPSAPTRIGTSVTRDTNPDLTFVRLSRKARGRVSWINTGENLGSDHYVLEIALPISAAPAAANKYKQRITDWTLFRTRADEEQGDDITDIDAWTKAIVRTIADATTEHEADVETPQLDSRLAHLLQARRSLQERWKKGRKTNHRLRTKIAKLGREITSYSKKLCTQRWHEVCSEADRQLHKGRTWKLLRCLLDDTSTKGYQQHRLTQIVHRAVKELGRDETVRRLNAKYLPSTPGEQHHDYAGEDNPELDRDIEEWEVRAVLQAINCKSAAGPDRVANKALRNLGDAAIASLTKFYNERWRAGRLPKQWKTARTVLIPKPGKPPNIDNLRPISLTSCVGKVLEHVLNNRWQRYLEMQGLYPNSMLGFRAQLSTQDAMIQLYQDITDKSERTRDAKAVLGLDLQGAFDNVKHSAILAQVSRLNLGKRTYDYVRDFLSERTVEICAGDLQLPPKQLGSVGTPQGSVISPLLFNLVMIGVARRLEGIPQVRHTIYADDITLWVPGGSDGHIENTLQDAVTAIEDHLADTGLRCAPQKSELLIVAPPGRRGKNDSNDKPNITVRTSDGIPIPQVATLRVLGMYLEASGSNKTTVDRLLTKIGTATRLIRRVATKHQGMREASLLRLLQSFAISHVAYVGAFHNWLTQERDRINAAIRKAYKTALGLLQSTSTDRLLSLGVHNTLEEISEAQRTAQLERLQATRTGRAILARLGLQRSPNETAQAGDVPSLPQETLQRLRVLPLPRNMHPGHHQDRRTARARALTDVHATDTGARYVDAAAYPGRPGTYVAVAVRATTGEVVNACSVRVRSARQAEEAAIALALQDPGCTTVISDSKLAITSFARNAVCESAVKIVKCSAVCSETTPATYLRWFPAHVDISNNGSGHPNRNETADVAARALTDRAAAGQGTLSGDPERRPNSTVGDGDDDGGPDPLVTYSEVLGWYRYNRRTMPPPHKDLTRHQAVLLRQLQTNSVLTPALARHVCPELYASEKCSMCRVVTATLAHIMWDCEARPREAADPYGPLPASITNAVKSADLDTQTAVVQQLEAALARQRPGETQRGTPGGRTPRGSDARRTRRRRRGALVIGTR